MLDLAGLAIELGERRNPMKNDDHVIEAPEIANDLTAALQEIHEITGRVRGIGAASIDSKPTREEQICRGLRYALPSLTAIHATALVEITTERVREMTIDNAIEWILCWLKPMQLTQI